MMYTQNFDKQNQWNKFLYLPIKFLDCPYLFKLGKRVCKPPPFKTDVYKRDFNEDMKKSRKEIFDFPKNI